MVVVMYELEVGLSAGQSSEWRPTNCRISQPDLKTWELPPQKSPRSKDSTRRKKMNHSREEKKTLGARGMVGRVDGKIRGPPADDDAAVHRDAWAPAFTATTLASGLGYILHLHPAQIPIS